MKKLNVFLFTLLMFCISNAFSQNLKNNGNTLGADGSVGSNSNVDFGVETNGTVRLNIENDGDVGIGTLTPTDQLHINTNVAGENGLRVQILGLTKLLVDDAGGVTVGSLTAAPANGLYVSGNAGIGISTPAEKFHVDGGTDSEPEGGGYIVTGTITGANVSMDNNEIMARSNGLVSDFFVNNDGGNVLMCVDAGSVGIGNNAPGSYRTKISHGSFGLDLENESSGDDWEFYVSGSNLNMYCNGSFKGSFSCTTGAYTAFSDRRLKNSIEPMTSMLDKINALEPVSYYVNGFEGGEKELGFIAQDVQNILPNLVYYNTDERGLDLYTMDYSGFGVIAIKGIQELQQQTEAENMELKEQIDALSTRLADIENALSQCCTSFKSTDEPAPSFQVTGAAKLEQNIPNPFTGKTIIQYYVPVSAASSQIKITSQNGIEVKTINIAGGQGSVEVDASQLTRIGSFGASGNYLYTLIVDGKIVDTKQMILTK